MAETSRDSEQRSSFTNVEMERKKLWKFYELLCISATLQGRVAYLLMSIHAVNPYIVKR